MKCTAIEKNIKKKTNTKKRGTKNIYNVNIKWVLSKANLNMKYILEAVLMNSDDIEYYKAIGLFDELDPSSSCWAQNLTSMVVPATDEEDAKNKVTKILEKYDNEEKCFSIKANPSAISPYGGYEGIIIVSLFGTGFAPDDNVTYNFIGEDNKYIMLTAWGKDGWSALYKMRNKLEEMGCDWLL